AAAARAAAIGGKAARRVYAAAGAVDAVGRAGAEGDRAGRLLAYKSAARISLQELRAVHLVRPEDGCGAARSGGGGPAAGRRAGGGVSGRFDSCEAEPAR